MQESEGGMTPKENDLMLQDDSSWTRLILDSVADGVFVVDHEGRITSFNKAAEKITGFSKKEAIGQYCHEIFRANTCFEACPLKHTAETAETIVNLEVNILNRDNKEIPISISTAVVTDADGNVVGAVETFRDLSLIKELRKEISDRYSFQDILGRSKSMLKLFQILPDIAQSEATVLIEGESGTGKELFAVAIHNLSTRKDKPLIKVTVPPSQRPSWNLSFLVTRKALLRTQKGINRDGFVKPTAGLFFWMKLGT